MYFQLFFALDRVKVLAPQHPEWKTTEPFASLFKADVQGALAGGEHAILKIITATHAGMTTDEFETTVNNWIVTAKHPKTERLLTERVYQPILELLAYLRTDVFKTFIVSGGGIEFMRPWTEHVYGIPPEQVVGSSGKLRYACRMGIRYSSNCLKSISLTTRMAILSAFNLTSAGGPFLLSATQTAISKCSSGRRAGAEHASGVSSTTRTLIVNGPMTASHSSAI